MRRDPDDPVAKPCTDCKHSAPHRPAFLSDRAPFGLVCQHKSAIRINLGSVWACSIAREACRGRRFEAKRSGGIAK